jgi:hypothetical protein
MAAGVWQLSRLPWLRQVHEAVGLAVTVSAGVLVYVAAAWAVQSPELTDLRRLFKGNRFER